MSILDLFDHSKENLSLSGKWCTPNSLKGTVYGGNTNSQNTMFQKYETFFAIFHLLERLKELITEM